MISCLVSNISENCEKGFSKTQTYSEKLTKWRKRSLGLQHFQIFCSQIIFFIHWWVVWFLRWQQMSPRSQNEVLECVLFYPWPKDVHLTVTETRNKRRSCNLRISAVFLLKNIVKIKLGSGCSFIHMHFPPDYSVQMRRAGKLQIIKETDLWSDECHLTFYESSFPTQAILHSGLHFNEEEKQGIFVFWCPLLISTCAFYFALWNISLS